MALGDIIEIDRRTLLVTGQELVLAKGQPDVANSLLHLADGTLFLVDTGTTEAFRDALSAAATQLGAWEKVVVLTTHGHVDHVGNNDLADRLAADRGATARHLVPFADLAQMRNPLGYWTTALQRVAGVVPGNDNAEESAARLLSIFRPLEPLGATTTLFENAPLEQIRIGPLRLSGWSFGDGAVNVVRTQGHCAGQVVVHLRDSNVLHLSDEPNGPCGAMHDADQLKILTALGHTATLLEAGAVNVLTEGHLFRLNEGKAALARVEAILGQAEILDQKVHDALPAGREPVDPVSFTERVMAAYSSLGAEGGNLNPIFAAGMALNLLRELGMTPPADPKADQNWTRPASTQ
jgi:glyoxylase-like metal-dependent hydrolase (beta-lactamase superfamily II)